MALARDGGMTDARSALARLIEESKPKPRIAAQTTSKAEPGVAQKEANAAAPAPAAALEYKPAETPRKEITETKTAARVVPSEADEKPARPRERKTAQRREKDRTAGQVRLQREFEAAQRRERLEKRRLAERRAAERRRVPEPEPAIRYYRAGAPELRRGGARFTDVWSD
jgi:hypothetical protein